MASTQSSDAGPEPPRSPRNTSGRPLIGSVLLAIVSIGLTLGALEALARRALRAAPRGKERNERAAYIESDRYTGWRKRGGARVEYRRSEYETEVVINSKGLRDREREYTPPPGTFRLLALGDSTVEGYSVRFENTVTQVLERTLDRPGCRVEAINGGTTGYSTDQEYVFWQQEGLRYHPNVVVLFFNANDVLYNILPDYFHIPKPVLALKDGRLVISNYPVPGLPRPAASSPAAVREAQPTGCAAWSWLRRRMMMGAPREYEAVARLGLWAPMTAQTPEEEFGVYNVRHPGRIGQAWQMTDLILATLAREVEATGSRFVVAYVPNRMEVNDRAWDLTQILYGLNPKSWDRHAVVRRLVKSGQRGSFPVLDLTSALGKSDWGLFGGPYYVADGHWNAYGHGVAARAILASLRERGWLPTCTKALR